MKRQPTQKSSSRVMSLGSVTACLLVLVVLTGTPASARLFSFSDFKGKGAERGMQQLTRRLDSIKHTPAQEAFDELEKVRRVMVLGRLWLYDPAGVCQLGCYNRIIILRLHNY